MLRFFRQLRKDQLMSDKTRKYLLYAVGEIFLVVIGILIALQVNNWNKERAENRQRTELLVQLGADLNNVLTELEIQIDQSIEKVTYSKKLLNFSAGTADFPTDSLQFASQIMINSSAFNDFNTTFEQAKSSGKLSLIQSDSLLFALSLLERSNEGLTGAQEGIFGFFTSPEHREFLTKTNILRTVEQRIEAAYSFAPDIHPEMELESVLKAYFKDPETYELMYQVQLFNVLENLWLVDYRQSVDEVIRQIDIELNR